MLSRSNRHSIAAIALTAPLSLVLLGGALAHEATPAAGSEVEAPLRDADDGEVGTVRLSEVVTEGAQVAVDLRAGTLAPGEHGIHIHETGVCDPAGDRPFSSAGGHYNPTGAGHGGLGDPDAHAGDLGNMAVDDDGSATVVIPTDRFALADLDDADGSALVIHADRDDLETDPAGNSGERVACAVLFPAEDGATPGAGTPGPDAPIAEAIATGLATALPAADSPDPGIGTPDPE